MKSVESAPRVLATPIPTPLWAMRWTYFWVFAFIGVYGPLAAPWMRSLGFDGSQIGAVRGAGALLIFVAPPLWGALADRLGDTVATLRIMLAAAAVASVPLTLTTSFPAVFAAVTATMAMRAGAPPLLDSVAVGRIRPGTYGGVRLWGSAGFIAAAFAAGTLADRWSKAAVPWGLVATSAAAALTAWRLGAAPRPRAARYWRQWGRVLGGRAWRGLLVVAFLNRLAAMAPLVFFSVYLHDAGYSNRFVAAFSSVGVLAEIAFFGLAARPLAARLGHRRLLAVATLTTGLRWALMGVVRAPWAMLAVQTLHALTFGAYQYAMVHIVDRTAPPALQASAQSAAGAVGFGLGGMVAALAGGWLYDAGGIGAVIGLSLVTTAVGVVAAVRLVPRQDDAVA